MPHAPHRQNLDALAAIVGIGLVTAGPDLKIRGMNDEAERLLGFQEGEGLGLSCREALGPHLCSSGCAFRQTLMDRETRRDWAVRVVTKKGDTRDLLLSTAFLEAENPSDAEVAITLRDVTEAEMVRRAIQDRWVFHGLICASGKMKEIVSLVRELAPYDSTVLILGESGTGKEIVARAVHEEGPRKDRPFITVNCSAYSEGLLESELFGHVRGAFTGAVGDRARPLRRRERRHALPRRDRGDLTVRAGEAPARPAGTHDRAGGRSAADSRRHPGRRGYEPRPQARGRPKAGSGRISSTVST